MRLRSADTDVLWRAYLTPLRNPSASLRIFWPFMLLYGVGSQLLTLLSSVLPPTGYGVALWLVIALCAWPLFAAGAIRWHRWLVLDEPVSRLSLADGQRLRHYFGRTVALGALGITVVLLFAVLALLVLVFLPKAATESTTLLTGFSLYFAISLLLVDMFVALVLTRFVLGLPIIATEPAASGALQKLGSPRPGLRATLLAATLPLTALYTLAAFGFPKLTPDFSDDPNFVMPAWAIALDCFDALMLDLLLFYTALVFLSALSFWYAKHERARLLPDTPASVTTA